MAGTELIQAAALILTAVGFALSAVGATPIRRRDQLRRYLVVTGAMLMIDSAVLTFGTAL